MDESLRLPGGQWAHMDCDLRAQGRQPMSAGPRVLLTAAQRAHQRPGNRYLSGWLGKASVVAFAGEPDRHGNPTWDLFVSEPQPRAEAGQSEAGTAAPGRTLATAAVCDLSVGELKPSAPRTSARGDGWRGSRYRRPANGARRAPAADDAPFYEDNLEDVGR